MHEENTAEKDSFVREGKFTVIKMFCAQVLYLLMSGVVTLVYYWLAIMSMVGGPDVEAVSSSFLVFVLILRVTTDERVKNKSPSFMAKRLISSSVASNNSKLSLVIGTVVYI